MERRILVNYRIDPGTMAGLLPSPFRPTLVGGQALAGICLLRLGAVRPAGLPRVLGLTMEGAAHRVAVTWDTADGPAQGVYIPRRDTSSRLATLAGGRAFPGWHHRARFDVEEAAGRYRIGVTSRDGRIRLTVAAHADPSAEVDLSGSVFGDLGTASEFFRSAPAGYATTPTDGMFDGVELETGAWAMSPVHLDDVSSSFFDDSRAFPPRTAVLDSAFLMEGLPTRWRALPELRAAEPVRVGTSS
jgi:uncharacterized protein YqjF (DUF2071 family)